MVSVGTDAVPVVDEELAVVERTLRANFSYSPPATGADRLRRNMSARWDDAAQGSARNTRSGLDRLPSPTS